MSAIAWNAVRDGNGITVRHQWNAHSSEGSRIEVMYEVNREPFESLPLLRVKTLSGMKRAFEEAFHVYEFMSALDLDLYREGVIEASAA